MEFFFFFLIYKWSSDLGLAHGRSTGSTAHLLVIFLVPKRIVGMAILGIDRTHTGSLACGTRAITLGKAK